MASWSQVAATEPGLAQAAQTLFDAHKHKVLATLRLDGSPRVSGIEAQFADGELWLGMMPGSVKARDLQRDPRLALHTASEDPPEAAAAGWSGDAKLSGRAVEVTDPSVLARSASDSPTTEFHLFRVELTELVVIGLGEPPDHLVIDVWQEGRGRRQIIRR